MECDQCGAPRPRTGPCPACGAPPPRLGSRGGAGGSSGSGARGRSQPGSASSSSGSRRSSGTNWGGGGSGGGLMSRGYDRQSGDGWDDEYADYGGATPGRSGGRFASGEYGGVDPSQALAQYNEAMPPSAEGGLMTGLPGFPQTDEEERAIGMRRPAYIPATQPKRKKKLSSGRVLSGVLSILLVTVGVCGGLGFLGQQRLAKILSGPLGIKLSSPTVDLSQVPLTPVSTPGPSAKIITSAVTAEGIDKDYNAQNPTSFFKVNSTVYVVVNIVGASQSGANTLTCRWFLDGIDYNLKSGTSVAVQASKTNNFHGYCGLPYYQTGVGMVKIYWNKPSSDTGDATNDKYLAQTIKFAIVANTPGTTTPGTGTPGTATPKSGKPTPSPTKKTGSAGSPFVWRWGPGVSSAT